MLEQEALQAIETYLGLLKDSSISYPFKKTLAVYSIGGTVFAYLETGKQLVNLSLRSDPHLAALLKERYEEVLPAQRLNQKVWITVVLSGQLSLDEIKGLIDHSYQLANVLNSQAG